MMWRSLWCVLRRRSDRASLCRARTLATLASDPAAWLREHRATFVVPDRATLFVDGEDSEKFLHSLCTNDMKVVTAERSVYAAFLNHQGRLMGDALVCRRPDGSGFVLDMDTASQQRLKPVLQRYILRSRVRIADGGPSGAMAVAVTFAPTSANSASQLGADMRTAVRQVGGWVFADPRRPEFGTRLIGPAEVLHRYCAAEGTTAATTLEAQSYYTLLQYRYGAVPRGADAADLVALEANLDLLEGVSFSKGCYVGQELTARTHHVGVVRKRIVPLQLVGDGADSPAPSPANALPAVGTEVYADPASANPADQAASAAKPVGRVLSPPVHNVLLAHIRLAALQTSGAVLRVGAHRAVALVPPHWPSSVFA